MKFKKTVLIIFMFVLALSIHTSAATKEEKAVKKVATSYFKAVKKYNATSISKTMVPKSQRKSFAFYTDSVFGKVIKEMHRQTFKYKITSVKVSGKTAKVKADITYYNGYQVIVDGFKNAYYNTINNAILYGTELSQEEFNELVFTTIDNTFFYSDWEDYTNDISTTLKFKKYKGKWKISTVTSTMNKYINCNAIKAIDYLDSIYG